MKKILLCLLLVTLCLMSSSALADGNELLKACKAMEYFINEGDLKKDGDLSRISFCYGILEGVRDTMFILSRGEAGLNKKLRVCFPEGGITNGQAVRIVVKYLEEHPEDLHKHEVALLMAAYFDAYPCKYA